jgi:hypothetical protein
VCVCVHASLAPIYHNASSQHEILEQDVYVDFTLQKITTQNRLRGIHVSAHRGKLQYQNAPPELRMCACALFAAARTTILHPERQSASLSLLVLLYVSEFDAEYWDVLVFSFIVFKKDKEIS